MNKLSQEPLKLGSRYLIHRLYPSCRQPYKLLINRGLLIYILIICFTSILGILVIHAQIVGSTGFQNYLLTKVFFLF